MASTPINEQGKILMQYLKRWNFLSAHLHLSPTPATSTYESEAHGSISTIDHILCPSHVLPSLSSCHVIEEEPSNNSDHLPITCQISTHLPNSPTHHKKSSPPPRPNWRKLTTHDLKRSYTSPLEASLSHLPLPSLSDYSSNPHLIDRTLSHLISLMKSTADTNIPSKRFFPHQTPEWDDELKLAQKTANNAHKTWRNAGKPRNPDHPLRIIYKESKRKFRAKLRNHRKNVRELFFSKLDLANTDSRKLFREIRNINGHSPEPSRVISFNGTTFQGDALLEGWTSYFEQLGVPSPHSTYDSDFQQSINEEYLALLDTTARNEIPITVDEVKEAIQGLKPHKASGPDGIDPEHIIHSGPLACNLLTDLFNAIVTTGHIPTVFQLGYITPIPKDPKKDQTDPSNYRGISLLSNISKLFEKVILAKLQSPALSLNPLQGGFRSGYSPIHTAFVLQEAIQSIRESGKKAYVALLDVKKAFDTVWHQGLFVKLHRKGIPTRIWHILNNWYTSSSCSVLQCGDHSRSFPILQGVRQGAILSPLLYSIFVDDLLNTLDHSCLGARIGEVFCGAPMYADDLALVASSPEELQAMLDIVSHYASQWHYRPNSSKSVILVFGESPRSRAFARSNRQWLLAGQQLQEVDEHHHLGILRSVHYSTLARTSERCAAGRSAFFALNAVGSRFGCLHPVTSHRLYSTLSLPIMLYGCELWSISKTESLMLERVHRKILRTIQGLPVRCPSVALTSLLGSRDISSFISQQQLTFINSIASMSTTDLPRLILEQRLTNPLLSGIIPLWQQLLDNLHLQSLEQLISTPRDKVSWKNSNKRLLNINHYIALTEECPDYPIGYCDLPLGKPSHHWSSTLHDRQATIRTNFRLRMLVGCDGLEADASRFRRRMNSTAPGNSTCKLCLTAPEDPAHFILRCPSLSTRRRELLSDAPSHVKSLLPDINLDPDHFVDVMLGCVWIKDHATQVYIVDFLNQLRAHRNALLLQPGPT